MMPCCIGSLKMTKEILLESLDQVLNRAAMEGLIITAISMKEIGEEAKKDFFFDGRFGKVKITFVGDTK